MSVVKILQYPDPRLKRISKWVDKIDDEVLKVVEDMFETHYAARNCAALAATQLDFAEAFRITVIDFSDGKNQPLCLINPEIFYREGEQIVPEGCMSVGGDIEDRVFDYIKRAMKIKVRALNPKGEQIEIEAEGFMAQCIQHEVDHLDGHLYFERLSPLKKERLIKRLAKQLKKP